MEKDVINKVSFTENFVLSGAAAVIAKTVAAPIERVKLLMQNQNEMLKQGTIKRPYEGIIDCSRLTLKNEGVVSFWRGNLVNVIRYSCYQAFNFAFKDSIKFRLFGDTQSKNWTTLPQHQKLAKNIISGGVAGCCSITFVYSLDYCRTRLANDALASKGGERKFNGIIDVYVKTVRSDGIRGLYRGFCISCFGIFIYRGLYFGLYDTLKPIIFRDNEASFGWSFLLAWFVTNVAGIIDYPVDTVRRRMMMTSGQAVKYRSSLDCATQIIRNEGFKSMMKGATANILRTAAGAGVLAGSDKLKEVYLRLKMS